VPVQRNHEPGLGPIFLRSLCARHGTRVGTRHHSFSQVAGVPHVHRRLIQLAHRLRLSQFAIARLCLRVRKCPIIILRAIMVRIFLACFVPAPFFSIRHKLDTACSRRTRRQFFPSGNPRMTAISSTFHPGVPKTDPPPAPQGCIERILRPRGSSSSRAGRSLHDGARRVRRPGFRSRGLAVRVRWRGFPAFGDPLPRASSKFCGAAVDATGPVRTASGHVLRDGAGCVRFNACSRRAPSTFDPEGLARR